MQTWRLRLEYDGSAYRGWQIQPGAASIQAEVERALARVLGGEAARVTASGRTDAGVHALGQVASFRAATPRSEASLRDGLNALLPGDIACLEARHMPADFHAMRSARGKLYRYVLRLGPARSALRRRRCWQLRYALDLDEMQRALDLLVGTHDFTSFRAAGCAARGRCPPAIRR